MAVGTLVGAFAAEVMLRLLGFEFNPFPVVQFGYPDPKTLTTIYRADKDLFWVPRDYDQRLARARREHPAIVFMGDSCTEFGKYPLWVLSRLHIRGADSATGIALGVSGWSSRQGLAQLKRDVLPLEPRVVTVYFGWNDHWMALGPPDGEIRRSAFVTWLLEHVRIAQLVEKVRLELQHRPDDPPRVSLPEYRRNLMAMAELVHKAGAEIVLITAPSNHQPGREPQYLLKRHLKRLDSLVPLHRAYVAATRQAARASQAVLCDAARSFEDLPAPHDRYFRADGIHLTDAGDAAMADMVSACVDSALARLNDARPPAP